MLQHPIRRAAMSVLTLIAVLGLAAGSVFADGNVQKISSTADGYCHLKIPAARPRTLDSDKPELKSSQTGDLIDYYGPCDVDPSGKDIVAAQKHLRTSKWGKLN
jgi:hypothetical protein